MKILLLLAVLVLVFILLVKYLESTAVFYPMRDISTMPRDISLEFEDIFFKTEDGVKLNGWWVKREGARWNLLYFHGNAGNIANRLGKIKVFHDLGFNVFIFDYRGYGKSDGRPSEVGLYKDALAAFDWLKARKDVGTLPIVLYGASLGGAVAIDLATKRNPAAIVTEATFTSAKDMARFYYSFVPSFLIGLDFSSDKKVRTIKAPKLFIHSRQDEIVPFALAEKLFSAAALPKDFLEVEGGHNDNFLVSEEKIREGLMRFLKERGI